jgi:hypothetical protein
MKKKTFLLNKFPNFENLVGLMRSWIEWMRVVKSVLKIKLI